MIVERDPAALFCPDSLKRRNPLFELTFELLFERLFVPLLNPRFELLFELKFVLPLAGLPSSRCAPEICDCPCSNERDPAVVFVFPRAEKKCWFCGVFRIVDGAAWRPLAEKLSRPGLNGTLPVVKRAFWNCP